MTPHVPLDLAAQADPPRVGAFRRALKRWLAEALEARQAAAGQPLDLPDEVADVAEDLVLATSEALENIVDHAFAGVAAPGTMMLRADLVEDVVTIVVADDGHWRAPQTGPTMRGRGLTLMQNLAGAMVEHARGGTTVTMRRLLPEPAHDRPRAQA
ncbi:MAG TPA: ATP-binding protein [Actinomycetospora sp.]